MRYKVTVDLDNDVPVFQPSPETDPPLLRTVAEPEESKISRKVAGTYVEEAENEADTSLNLNLVTLFRRIKRKYPIIYPFRASIWL